MTNDFSSSKFKQLIWAGSSKHTQMKSLTSDDNRTVSVSDKVELNLYNSRCDHSRSFVDGRGERLSSYKWLRDNDACHVDATSQRDRRHSWRARDGCRDCRRPHNAGTLLQAHRSFTYNNNNSNNRFTALCPGPLGWAGTRRNTHPPTILIIIQSLSSSFIFHDP